MVRGSLGREQAGEERVDALARAGRRDDRPVVRAVRVRGLGAEVRAGLGREEARELRVPVAVLATARASVVAQREGEPRGGAEPA